jgi:hypothetical protein
VDVWVAWRAPTGFVGKRYVNAFVSRGLWLDEQGNLLSRSDNHDAIAGFDAELVVTHWMPVPPSPEGG